MVRFVMIFLLAFSAVLPLSAADYEQPSAQKASDILSAGVLRGSHHQVAAQVSSDGYTFTFTIGSKFGAFQAKGRSQLAIRLQEIAAIAELKEITGSEAFAKAVGAAAMKPVDSAVNVAQHPVETAKGIPGGAKRSFENFGRWAKRGGEKVSGDKEENIDPEEDGEEQAAEKKNSGSAASSATKSFLGVTSAYRQWAQKVGVDPYSSNAVLQEELNRLAKYDAAGKLGTNILRPKIPGVETATNANDLVWGKDPEELRKLNEKRLLEMGVDQELSKQFLDHKILTPSDQTNVVASLYILEKTPGRAEFIRTILKVRSEEEALFYRDSAAILEKMHKSGTRITGFIPNPRIALVRASDRIVAVLPADRLFWTESFAAALQAFLQQYRTELQGVKVRELWLSGDATKRARAELSSRGWTIRDNLLRATPGS